MEWDIHPPVEREKMNHFFTSIAKFYKKYGTIYVNNIGNFRIRSIEVYIVIFILYNWTKNKILEAPIKDTKYEKMIDDFQTHIQYITKRGFKPSFNINDNVESKAIKVYLQEKNPQMQWVEYHNHHLYSSEREIQILKNNFIAGLSIG